MSYFHYRYKDEPARNIDELDGMLIETEIKALQDWVKAHGRHPKMDPHMREHLVQDTTNFPGRMTPIVSDEEYAMHPGQYLQERVWEMRDPTEEDLEEIQMFHLMRRLNKWNSDIRFNRGLAKYKRQEAEKQALKVRNSEMEFCDRQISSGRKDTLLSKYKLETGKSLGDFYDLCWTNYRPFNLMTLNDLTRLDVKANRGYTYLIIGLGGDKFLTSEIVEDAKAIKVFVLKYCDENGKYKKTPKKKSKKAGAK